jgi:hypothetical protein
VRVCPVAMVGAVASSCWFGSARRREGRSLSTRPGAPSLDPATLRCPCFAANRHGRSFWLTQVTAFLNDRGFVPCGSAHPGRPIRGFRTSPARSKSPKMPTNGGGAGNAPNINAAIRPTCTPLFLAHHGIRGHDRRSDHRRGVRDW